MVQMEGLALYPLPLYHLPGHAGVYYSVRAHRHEWDGGYKACPSSKDSRGSVPSKDKEC